MNWFASVHPSGDTHEVIAVVRVYGCSVPVCSNLFTSLAVFVMNVFSCVPFSSAEAAVAAAEERQNEALISR